jgi:ribose-phosphate pyrophosphokinase
VSGMKRTTEKNLMVFSGRAYPDLAVEVADLLECGLVPQDARTFANGELSATRSPCAGATPS